MSTLLLALGAFVAFHMVPALGPVRRGLVTALGMRGYIISYSLLSIGLLMLVAEAYVNAETTLLWVQWPWTRWVPALTMPFVCILIISTLSEPNPLSVGVKGDQFDLRHPGIVSVTRHPLLWALALWAGAHLAPNGDSASVVLFGLFGLLAGIGMISLDVKKRHELGAVRWQELTAGTSPVPFWAILRGRTRFDWRTIGAGRVGLGLGLYGGFLALHEIVIGANPLP